MPVAGPASAYPPLSSPASICFTDSKDVCSGAGGATGGGG